MRVLVIGGAGFVGGHLIEYLVNVDNVIVYATKLANEKLNYSNVDKKKTFDLNILNKEQVFYVIKEVMPDFIIHLAAQSSVSLSWKEPSLTFEVNVIGTIHILEAVKSLMLKTRTILVGSAEEYGDVKPDVLKINEMQSINPKNPYAISKASQELIARLYVESNGIDIIMVRAFNQIGPRQSSIFVVSDFAKQIVEIECGNRKPVMHVGNLKVKRDFCDARDAVKAYWYLMKFGKKGEIYNIGSGNSIFVSDILKKMLEMSTANISVEVDYSKYRETDILELCADISKVKSHTSWAPEIGIEQSLTDTLNYWRTIYSNNNFYFS